MARPHLRPRIHRHYPVPIDRVRDAILARAEQKVRGVTATASSKHLVVEIAPPSQRFASPVMDLELRQIQDGTLMTGWIGPHPRQWTLFIGLYATSAFGMLFSGIWDLTRVSLDMEPNVWPFFVASAALGTATFVAGFIGRGVEAGQIRMLLQTIRKLEEDLIPAER